MFTGDKTQLQYHLIESEFTSAINKNKDIQHTRADLNLTGDVGNVTKLNER